MALGRIRPRLVLAAVGVVHVVVLEHETDLGAIQHDLVAAVESAASKITAMVALVAHNVEVQRSGEL
eukprot:5291827-Pleurochrysis_carterae.AAC.1